MYGRALSRANAAAVALEVPPVRAPLQLAIATSYKELAPGLTVGVTGTLPDPESGAPAGCQGSWSASCCWHVLYPGVPPWGHCLPHHTLSVCGRIPRTALAARVARRQAVCGLCPPPRQLQVCREPHRCAQG
jgi:hypothetical protein